MQHFSTQHWIDFARKTALAEQQEMMQKHLNTGCKDCAEELGRWTRVAEFGIKETENQPPEAIVRKMKMAMGKSPERARNRMREIAELIFDSYLQPQMAGVRSTAATPRQLMYRAGDVLIDMRLESQSDPDRFTVMGQVLRSLQEKQAMQEVPIYLLSGSDELAQTSTNQFGEFFLEHEAGKDLQISLEVSNQKEVFIPLDESIWRVAFGS